MKATIETTDEQCDVIMSLLEKMEPGGSIIGQAYPDGIRLRVLTAEEAVRVANSLLTTHGYHGTAKSADQSDEVKP